jgi:DNA-binding transcriptional MerR regulator
MTVRQLAIGGVAGRLGLDPDTLRYFERRGIVPPPQRDAGGRRICTDDAVHLLEVLLHLRRTGMPLAEIAQFTQFVSQEPTASPSASGCCCATATGSGPNRSSWPCRCPSSSGRSATTRNA